MDTPNPTPERTPQDYAHEFIELFRNSLYRSEPLPSLDPAMTERMPPRYLKRLQELLERERKEYTRFKTEKLPAEDAEPSHSIASGLKNTGYTVVEELGKGGMGIVYLVKQEKLPRELALKTIRSVHKENLECIERFWEEVHFTAQLQHPGIPPLHDTGHLADGRPYYTMKYIKKDTLEKYLNERPSPEYELVKYISWFAQICQAVGYAHDRGLIHRDLKPANIMIGAFGEVQVMDWGLARKVVEPNTSAAQSTGRTQPTTSFESPRDTKGFLDTKHGIGTYDYMSPEQAAGKVGGKSVDRRSDVFSLGAILCKIITGTPPPGLRNFRSEKGAGAAWRCERGVGTARHFSRFD